MTEKEIREFWAKKGMSTDVLDAALTSHQKLELIKILGSADAFHSNCKRRNISDDIVSDTLGRFVDYFNTSIDDVSSDSIDTTAWMFKWADMQLFSIGALEYQLGFFDGVKAIYIRIPKGADISSESVTASIRAAKTFFINYFPAYSQCDYVFHSWMLSPRLREILPDSSKIIKFAELFEIKKVYPTDKKYIPWIFDTSPDTPPVMLSESSSLQKGIKEMLLRGENIGTAIGLLKK